MVTPPQAKNVRLSAETHARLAAVADTIGGTMDDAVAHLLAEGAVRVPASAQERHRWSQAAAHIGVPLEEFVRHRVEAYMQFGCDQAGVMHVYEYVRGIAEAVGAEPVHVYRTPPPPVPRPAPALTPPPIPPAPRLGPPARSLPPRP